MTSFGNNFCLKKRSRLIKALDNRFYVKFMQPEIVYSYGKPDKSILLRKRFLHVWGGGEGGGGGDSRKNVSQILAIIDFFKQRNYRKKPCQQGRIL